MTDASTRIDAPKADAIERRLTSLPVKVVRPLTRTGIWALGGVRGFSWSAEGLHHLRSLETPCLLAANHTSHADTAAILGVLPRAMRRRTCVAAALDVFGPAHRSRRLLARGRRECLQILVAAGFNAFAFDRQGSSLRSIRTACDLMERGWNMLLFPEGTRSRTGQLGEFKAGVGVLAKRTDRPIIPVHVHGGPAILPCGRTLPRSGRATVRFGAPLRPWEGESSTDFVVRLREAIRAMAPPVTTVVEDAPQEQGQVAGLRY